MWSKKIGLLFTLFTEKFSKISPSLINIHVNDKILRPLELIALGNVDPTDTDVVRFQWDKKFCESLRVLNQWIIYTRYMDSLKERAFPVRTFYKY